MSFAFGIPESEIAKQVAELINGHNQLAQLRMPQDILLATTTYILEIQGKRVLGVCGVDRQSYTFTEIKHLVVRPQFRRKGIARFLVSRAASQAATQLIFASIRGDNQSSLTLFKSLGFEPSANYPTKDHEVIILTKVNQQWQKKFSGQTWSPVAHLPPQTSVGPELPSE